MAKPIPPRPGVPDAPTGSPPADSGAALPDPNDPGFMFPPPTGPDASAWAEAVGGPSGTSLAPLDDERIVCRQCRHGHLMRVLGPVQNRRPDGTPFEGTVGRCLLVPQAPMDFGELLRVVDCDRFAPRLPLDSTVATESPRG